MSKLQLLALVEHQQLHNLSDVESGDRTL